MKIKGSQVDQEIVDYVAAKSMWVAVDIQKSVLFEFSRAGAEMMCNAKGSKIFWLGNAAIFVAANIWGASGGPSIIDLDNQAPMSAGMEAFSAITSIGLSASALMGLLRHFKQGAFTRLIEADLDSITAPLSELQARAKALEGGELSAATQIVLGRLAKLRKSKQGCLPKGLGAAP